MNFGFSFTEMVTVGHLTDEEAMRYRQVRVLQQEIEALDRQLNIKRAELQFVAHTMAHDALQSRGYPSGASCNFTEAGEIQVPKAVVERAS